MKYSVIIPIHNEEKAIVPLCLRVQRVMDRFESGYEILVVDDGSSDHSLRNLKDSAGLLKSVSMVVLSRRFGKSEALQAGFDNAMGDIYITIDGDGQDEPEDIPVLLRKMDEGYDVVYGWRAGMMAPLGKRVFSKAANLARRIFTGVNIHDVGCPLRVFRRNDISAVRLSGGLHRYFSTIMSGLGYRVAEVNVRHYPRASGVSKYGIADRLIEGIVDFFRVIFGGVAGLKRGRRKYEIRQIMRGLS